MWNIPKLNWRPMDFLSNDEFHRIKGNIEYLINLAFELYKSWAAIIMPTLNFEKTHTSDVFNSIESNIQLLIDNAKISANFEQTRHVQENEPVRSFNDINRIERMSLNFYNMFHSQKANKPYLQFELGGDFFG